MISTIAFATTSFDSVIWSLFCSWREIFVTLIKTVYAFKIKFWVLIQLSFNLLYELVFLFPKCPHLKYEMKSHDNVMELHNKILVFASHYHFYIFSKLAFLEVSNIGDPFFCRVRCVNQTRKVPKFWRKMSWLQLAAG